MNKGIIILDFGSQYNQLIGRRIREMEVYSEILPFNTSLEEIKSKNPAGIILSGGPSSVNSPDAHLVEKELFELGIPVLGICYGMQLTAHLLGGNVKKGEKGEYGKATLEITKSNPLFTGVSRFSTVWMSHFDEVETLPENFEISAKSGVIAGIFNEKKNIYCVQFHPEVSHSEFGARMLENFVFQICKAEKNWKLTNYIEKTVAEIREKVGNDKVILGLSGGVDSSVAAVLIHKAIGDQLQCIFVDTGLLRKDEGKKVMENYGEHFHMNIDMVDASERFLSKLAGVSDPEEKRKIIGGEFIRVFEEEARKLDGIDFLAQGTIYPDIVESGTKTAKMVKSHHNVGGLPEDLKFELVEPLRQLFKDEVRACGLELGLPYEMVFRQPFPGPGLGVRCLGAITRDRLEAVREADAILREEFQKAGLDKKVWQYFTVVPDFKSVGVRDNARSFDWPVIIRAVNTVDAMTATIEPVDWPILMKITDRILKEVKNVNRVCYDMSPKPNATIEWE